jgi:hypothetical protein
MRLRPFCSVLGDIAAAVVTIITIKYIYMHIILYITILPVIYLHNNTLIAAV